MKTTIILLAVLALPAFYGVRQLLKARKSKKQQRALALAYERLMMQNKLSIEYSEIVGNRVLALDKRARKLIVVDHTGGTKMEICLPLTSIAQTTIIRKKGADGCIQKIFLELKHKRADTTWSICFFDATHDALSDMLSFSRIASYWKNRIDIYKYPGSVSRGYEFVL